MDHALTSFTHKIILTHPVKVDIPHPPPQNLFIMDLEADSGPMDVTAPHECTWIRL